MTRLQEQYQQCLLQAHIIDEGIQALKDDGTQLVASIGAFAFVWARWNLEGDDKFRQNEVLLIMSTLLYNTINGLEIKRKENSLQASELQLFLETCEYFMLLLMAVEWPGSWKTPLMQRIGILFPQLRVLTMGERPKDDPYAIRIQQFNALHPDAKKDHILKHPYTKALERLKHCENTCLAAGEEFFNRHKTLYGWVMNCNEAIANDFFKSTAPSLRNAHVEHVPVGIPLVSS
jgi:hypothetical protein